MPGPSKPLLITHRGLYSQPTEEVGTLLPHITGEVRVKRLGQAQSLYCQPIMPMARARGLEDPLSPGAQKASHPLAFNLHGTTPISSHTAFPRSAGSISILDLLFKGCSPRVSRAPRTWVFSFHRMASVLAWRNDSPIGHGPHTQTWVRVLVPFLSCCVTHSLVFTPPLSALDSHL